MTARCRAAVSFLSSSISESPAPGTSALGLDDPGLGGMAAAGLPALLLAGAPGALVGGTSQPSASRASMSLRSCTSRWALSAAIPAAAVVAAGTSPNAASRAAALGPPGKHGCAGPLKGTGVARAAGLGALPATAGWLPRERLQQLCLPFRHLASRAHEQGHHCVTGCPF